jgi:response regulator RpfG family c-di-GMP phosphodiesterase
VAEIAYAHHEKLNGRGYPRKLSAADIPIQSRMMTVSDIYDALTASDRPYKRAISTERALDILKMEVGDGPGRNPLHGHTSGFVPRRGRRCASTKLGVHVHRA